MERLALPGRDILGIRASNPGPFSLTGTNSWIVGRNPAWLIDPGPLLPDHLDALLSEVSRRGGAAAILLTHDHLDHSEAVPELRHRLNAPVMAARGEVERTLRDGDELGPLRVVATPGHAPDHLSFLDGRVLFSGDAVLGEGSVFISPDPGALRGYLAALERLQGFELDVLCPGHGPVREDVHEVIAQYIAHRLDRERRLVEALNAGMRSSDELLDAAWSDAPHGLRAAAAVTLAAHLDKLEEEGRLPEGVQRP